MKIGIDLGGTKLLAGFVDERGMITDVQVEKSKSDCDKQTVLDQLISLIDRRFSRDVTLIGIGVPAIVDSENGIVYKTTSIPSWDEVHLKEILEERFRVPVQVSNDCNCFASGILQCKDYQEYDDMVCITLGTGVGSGLIFNRYLYTGKNSLAGEIGCIPYLDKDYEFYCSSRFFISKGTSGKDAGIKASEGDSDSLRLWNEFGAHLGNLLQTVLFAYDPQAIVLGGSITDSYGFFRSSMMKKLSDFPYRDVTDKLAILTADTNSVMIIGATSTVLDNH